jgi:translocation and assembly module TamB
MTAHPPRVRAPRSRLRRWLRRIGYGVLVLAVLVALALTVILRGLDRPFVKGRLQAMVRESAGLDIDYRATRVAVFSGLHVEDLVVKTPESLRAFAPELVRVGKIETGWSRSSLFGSGPTLNVLVLDGVELTVVADEKGRTSITEIPAKPAPPPTGPATPLSRLMADALTKAPAVARISVGKLSAKLIRVKDGKEVERIGIGPLALQADADRKGAAWRLKAAVGSQATPIEISVQRTHGGEALARLWLDTSVAGDEAITKIDLEVVKQTLAPMLKVQKLLHLEAAARFDAKSKQTEIALRSTEAADHAVSVEATVVVPDAGSPIVKKAAGALDLVHLLGMVPDGMLPVTLSARKATAKYQIEGLVLDKVPRVLEGGSASAEGDIEGFTLDGPVRVSVDDGSFAVKAHPAKDGATALNAKVPVHRAELTLGKRRVSAAGLEVSADTVVDREGAWSGTASVGFASAATNEVQGTSTRLKVDGRGLQVNLDDVLQSRGQLEIGGQIGALRFAQGKLKIHGDGIGLSAKARLSGKAPYAIDVDVPLQKLRVIQGKPLVDGRARVGAALSQIWVDGARTRANAQLTVELEGLTSKVLANKHADSVDFDITAQASQLTALRALVALDAPWERIGLSLTSKGNIAHLLSKAPLVKHHTELRLERPRVAGLSASQLALIADSSGTFRKHGGTFDVRARGLQAHAATLGDSHLNLVLGFDAGAPSVKVELRADGDGPTGTIATELAFDRGKREIAYDIDAHVGHLAALAPLAASSRALAGFDLAKLELVLKGKGKLRGVIDSVRDDGLPIAARKPALTANADGDIDVRALGFHWSRGDRDLKAPLMGWRGVLRTDGDKRLLHGELRLDALHIIAGEHHIRIERASDSLDVMVTGDLGAGAGTLVQSLKLQALRQDVAPQYPLGDLTWTLVARRNTDGVINIDKLLLDNQAGGTTFSLERGGFDFADERRSMSVKGVITQDLAKLWNVRDVYQARGDAKVSLSITSANFSMFRARANLQVSKGWLKLPRAGVEVEELDGDIPISADLIFDKRGPKLLRDTDAQPYAQLRFADQHPMMARRSYISIKRIATPFLIAGPLGGNLKIEHNIVALNQIEMGVRNGRLTGQAVLDWGGDDSTLQLHLRASKIEATKGEPFDGNAAVVFALRDRSLEGRAEILRIGRQHLLDLLDLHDPHRGDVSVNRIRRGLALGYPDRVRLAFDHGFARVKVTLGGVGALLRIDELRGIPMGPIIDKALAKLTRPPQEPVE